MNPTNQLSEGIVLNTGEFPCPGSSEDVVIQWNLSTGQMWAEAVDITCNEATAEWIEAFGVREVIHTALEANDVLAASALLEDIAFPLNAHEPEQADTMAVYDFSPSNADNIEELAATLPDDNETIPPELEDMVDGRDTETRHAFMGAEASPLAANKRLPEDVVDEILDDIEDQKAFVTVQENLEELWNGARVTLPEGNGVYLEMRSNGVFLMRSDTVYKTVAHLDNGRLRPLPGEWQGLYHEDEWHRDSNFSIDTEIEYILNSLDDSI